MSAEPTRSPNVVADLSPDTTVYRTANKAGGGSRSRGTAHLDPDCYHIDDETTNVYEKRVAVLWPDTRICQSCRGGAE